MTKIRPAADLRAEPTLDQVLLLEEVETDVFRTLSAPMLASADARGDGARQEGDRQRVFGGQLLGQALLSAFRTVPAARRVHSLHAYFVAGASASAPIDYHVERVRDGGSVSNRRSVARQNGRELLSLQASFQEDNPGVEHQDSASSGLDHSELEFATGEASHPWSGIELKFGESEATGSGHVVRRRVWFRTAEHLDDDPSTHAGVLAYASDLTLVRTALEPHNILATGTFRLASLDHAIWFHRPARVDEWLLLESVSPAAGAGRALTLGYVYDAHGSLVATVAQEGVLRLLE